jgi:ABC-type multidrug transport system fused ATPase/permease subunit
LAQEGSGRPVCPTLLYIAMKVAALVLLAALAGASGLSVGSATVSSDASENAANPIRRVVNLLQNMQKKITAEGEKDQEIYDKFMCYCKNSGGDLSKTIAEAENKVPQVESALAEAEAMKEQLESDLKQHKASRDEAKEAVAKATALREKEAAAFAKEKSDMDTNIAALAKATSALEKGMTGFLQTNTASVLRRLAIDMDLSSVDRDVLASFLSTGSRQGYAPQSGEITGILKEMKDTMEKELATAVSEEDASIKNFQELADAKA